jgi:hypothetical protein
MVFQKMDVIREKGCILSDVILTYLEMIQTESILTCTENRMVLLSGLINIAYELKPAIKKVPFMHIKWAGINLTEDLNLRLYVIYMVFVKTSTILYMDLIQSIYNYYSPQFVFIDAKLAENDKNVLMITDGTLKTIDKKYDELGNKLCKIWNNGTLTASYTTKELLHALKGKTPTDIYCDSTDDKKLLLLIHD